MQDHSQSSDEITHQVGDRVLVLHNIALGNLIGTVTAIHFRSYEVTLDGGGKDNMFGFQLQPLPTMDPTPKPCPECNTPAEHLENNIGHYTYCPNEDCPSRPCTRAHPTDEAAITAWNNHETH